MPAYQTYYEILGLDYPPEDRKAVKRAYSKLLKVTRPEDDPDGFMRLRNAHDTALNVIARKVENAAWEAQQAIAETPKPAADTETPPEPALTYEDMIPETEASDTAYSIGSTPNLDAPSMPAEEEPASDSNYSIGPTPSLEAPIWHAEPQAPSAPPLMEELQDILDNPKHHNDREKWNQLFRKARQLDIDDYVDFEDSLFNQIIQFYEFYDPKIMEIEYPGRLPEKISQSIAASLFKTMSWDKINTRDPHKNMQIEWLARRMRVRHVMNSKSEPLPPAIPNSNSGGFGNIWLFLFIIFIAARIVMAVVDS